MQRSYNIVSHVDFDRVYQFGSNATLSVGGKTELHIDGIFQSESNVVYPIGNTLKFQKKIIKLQEF
ncbi:MAG: hypothetical protein ACK5H1_05355 [Tenacibaculum sp.]